MYNGKILNRVLVMQKNKLKSLLDDVCESLFSHVKENDGKVTKEKIADMLHETAYTIEQMNENDISNKNLTKSLFFNIYKEIAKKSLLSYKDTSLKFKELNQIQEDVLIECNEKHIDLPKIIKKFDGIQNHMSDEIHKANNTITNLYKQVKNLEIKSNLDELTKVYNRRALATYLNKMCVKDKVPVDFYILMIDIDDFKVINDKFGHIAGDKILIFLTNIVKKTLRDSDKIFRFGGDEFIIILNRINDLQYKIITQRLLDIVEKSNLIYKDEDIKLTISMGATKLIQGDDSDSVVERADKALYKAKENGKNQIFWS